MRFDRATAASRPSRAVHCPTFLGHFPSAVPSSNTQHVFVFKPQPTCCVITSESLCLIMAFFAGASNVTIFGGSFVNDDGTHTKIEGSRHSTVSTSINSNNKSTSNVINSYNDNSTTISEQCDGFTFNGRLLIYCSYSASWQ